LACRLVIVDLSSHGLSQIIISGINYAFGDWRVIIYVCSVGIVGCSIASLFIIKEDPVFLFEFGRIAEAKRVIVEIGE
jgi:hypothetical protein